MKIQDRIWGSITIDHPLILELINSKPFQRLKYVYQNGPTVYSHPKRNVTRYEHSIGVWYLSKYFKCPLDEQAACLLHDISHTAFSHVADYVFAPDGKQNYHERIFHKIVAESEIPDILKKYDISEHEIFAEDVFPLLTADLPDLSFDRIDYFLREGVSTETFSQGYLQDFIKHLTVHKNQLALTDAAVATETAILFMNFCRLYWLDPQGVGIYWLFSKALARAMKLGLLIESDLFKGDDEIVKYLLKSKDREIVYLVKAASNNPHFVYASKSKADYYTPNRPRTLNPLILQGKKTIRLTDHLPTYINYMEEFKERYKLFGVKWLK